MLYDSTYMKFKNKTNSSVVIEARTVVTWGCRGMGKGKCQLSWGTGGPSGLMT